MAERVQRIDHDKDGKPSVATEGVTAAPEDPTISRRGFLTGALGAGAAVVAAGSEALLAGCSPSKKEPAEQELVSHAVADKDVPVMQVLEEQVLEGTGFEEAPFGDYLELIDTFDLPVGSLAFQVDSELVLTLLPTKESDSLRQIGLLDLNTGELSVLVESPMEKGRNVVIYDARASKTRLIWVELDLGTFGWKTYVATILGKVISSASLVEEGDLDYEPPMLAVAGDKVYWTVMPNAEGKARQEDSYLRMIPGTQVLGFGQVTPQTLLTSHGRMCTNPLVTEGILTVTPRVDTTNVYHQLTAIDCKTDKVIAFQVLPQSMKVSDALYYRDGFVFSIDANYNYAGGLRYFGIYQQLPEGDYLHISKPPTNAIVQIDNVIYTKSTNSILGVDTFKHKLLIVRTPPLCSDYGEAMVGWGVQERLVTCSIRMRTGGKGPEAVMIRVFNKKQPPEEEPAEEPGLT